MSNSLKYPQIREASASSWSSNSRRLVRKTVKTLERNLRPLILIAVIWEVTALVTNASPILMPRLQAIGVEAANLISGGVLFQHVAYTLFRLIIGFVLGLGVGVLSGLIATRVKWFEEISVPIAAMLMPIPVLAFVPLFILWFGLGNLPVIGLVFMGVVTPVFVNVFSGARSVDQTLIAAAESMGAKGGVLFRTMILPGSLPYVIGGARVGLARGWRAVIAGEMVSASSFGLGWMIFHAQSLLQTAIVLVGIALIGLTGVFLERMLFTRLERATVGRWGMMQFSGE